MKNTTRKKVLHRHPSDKTRWAYAMQAIEPTSETINKQLPGYHPQWASMSQRMNIAPESFTFLRLMLGLTIEQCAAYLRVDRSTVSAWENGRSPITFTAFELLRVVSESASFKLSHPEWDGWFMSSKGQLVSPDVGCSFTPSELNLLSFQRRDLSFMRGEIARLQAALDAATAENTKLRQMFLSQGVVDELASMQDRLNALIAGIATAHVIPFPDAKEEQRKEKVA